MAPIGPVPVKKNQLFYWQSGMSHHNSDLPSGSTRQVPFILGTTDIRFLQAMLVIAYWHRKEGTIHMAF